MTRIITEAEALAISPDAEHVPTRHLNKAGYAAVDAFVAEHAASPERHRLPAWYGDAEDAANDASPGETILIEMGRQFTRTKNPVTLRLEPQWFDWVVND